MSQKEKQQQHSCPVPACGAQIACQHLMCFRHWRLVPGNLQLAVVVNWKRGAGAGTPAHQDAADAAIAAVRAKVTWPCDFCGRPRPCHLIERVTKQEPMHGLPDRTLEKRYCNDTRGCWIQAVTWAEPPQETAPLGV